MNPIKLLLGFWLASNAVGVVAFLHFASLTWLEPELRGEDVARGGDAFVWFVSALPILVIFLVANFVWLGVTIGRSSGTKHWRPTAVACSVLACWFGVALFDQLNH
jgi:ABC-type amino acid transport system permease subunit